MATVLNQLRNHICHLTDAAAKEKAKIYERNEKAEKLRHAIEKAEALNELLEGLDIPQEVRVVRKYRRKIKSVDVLEAIQANGGTATTDDLKKALGVQNGQRFAGVRSSLLRKGLITVGKDGVYTLKEADNGN